LACIYSIYGYQIYVNKMSPQELQIRFRNFGIAVLKLEMHKNITYGVQHLVNQLVRSATSAGLNYAEACSAESKSDFIHKLRIVHKELSETKENIALLKETPLTIKLPSELSFIYFEADELNAIITKSIQTAVKNRNLSGNIRSDPTKKLPPM